MAVKPVRDKESYNAALARLEQLADARVGTSDGDEADVLATLIELYEKQNEKLERPTALEAIKFRMGQLGLKPRDLVPDIGSRSRVSEVLAGQRPLTIEMIKSLHERWGIPLASLINVDNFERIAKPEPSKAVLKRLQSLGFLKGGDDYYAFRKSICRDDLQAAYRRRTTSTTDAVALDAWCVATLARSQQVCTFEVKPTTSLDGAFLRDLAQCSVRPNGLRAAREMLTNVGICFVALRHFPSTHLDGAAMLREDGVPIVALTLRHDRIDNFWFTLLHECAHVVLQHVGEAPIFDDLEIAASDDIENAADELAMEALIPSHLWAQFGANEFTSTADILELANEAGVHAAVVAGRWRKELNNYRKFSALLGHGSVRRAFEGDTG